MKITKHQNKNIRQKNKTKKLKKPFKTKKIKRNKKQNISLKKGGSGKAPPAQSAPDLDRTPEHDAARDKFSSKQKITYNNEEYQFIFINLIYRLQKRLAEMRRTTTPEDDDIIKEILTKFIIFFSDPDVLVSNFAVFMRLDIEPKYQLSIYKPQFDNIFFPYCEPFIHKDLNKFLNYNLFVTSSYLSIIYYNIVDQNICIYLTYILYKTILKILPYETVSLVSSLNFFNLSTPLEIAIETNKLRLAGVLMYIIDKNRPLIGYEPDVYYPSISYQSGNLTSIQEDFLVRAGLLKSICMKDHTEAFCNKYIEKIATDYMETVLRVMVDKNKEIDQKIRENNIVGIYFKKFGDYVDNLDRRINPNDKKEFWEFYYKAFNEFYERDPDLRNIEIVTGKAIDDVSLFSAFDTPSALAIGKKQAKNKSNKKGKIKTIAKVASILPEEDIKKESNEELEPIESSKHEEKETNEESTELAKQQEEIQPTSEEIQKEEIQPTSEEITEPPQPPLEINMPFYSNEELQFFKHIINSWMVDSICQKIKDKVVNYSIKQTLNTSNSKLNFTQEELKAYNIMSCAIFIIIGLISHKLNERGDYQLIIKGGKGLQLSFIDYLKYNFESEDIDALLVNKINIDDYDKKLKIATYIGELIKWIIEIPTFKNVGFLNPRENNTNKNVGKISYINGTKKLAILDIDIKFPVDNIEEKLKIGDYEYTKLHEFGFPLGINFYDFQHEQIDEKTFPIQELLVSFFYQKIDTALKEKIYLYTKYFILIEIIKKMRYSPTTPENIIITDRDIKEYTRLLQKFKRSIKAIFFYLYERNSIAAESPFKQLRKYNKQLAEINSLETKPNLTQVERIKIGKKDGVETEIKRYEELNNNAFQEYAQHEYFNHLIYQGTDNDAIFHSIMN